MNLCFDLWSIIYEYLSDQKITKYIIKKQIYDNLEENNQSNDIELISLVEWNYDEVYFFDDKHLKYIRKLEIDEYDKFEINFLNKLINLIELDISSLPIDLNNSGNFKLSDSIKKLYYKCNFKNKIKYKLILPKYLEQLYFLEYTDQQIRYLNLPKTLKNLVIAHNDLSRIPIMNNLEILIMNRYYNKNLKFLEKFENLKLLCLPSERFIKYKNIKFPDNIEILVFGIFGKTKLINVKFPLKLKKLILGGFYDDLFDLNLPNELEVLILDQDYYQTFYL